MGIIVTNKVNEQSNKMKDKFMMKTNHLKDLEIFFNNKQKEKTN